MKKRILILTICFAALGSGLVLAQNQKPAPPATQTEIQRPREYRTEEKKEELSKKLLKRKNELREEEHEHERKHHSTEAKEKSDNPK